MKKFSLSKIVSLALVCAMLMGAFMFTTVSAEDAGTTLEIVSQNVFFDEKLELMFAFNAPAGYSATATVNGEPIDVVLYEENPTQDGVKVADYAYKVVQGVVPHAIDTVVTFTVTCNGTTVSKDYSVLQYIYERMYVSAKKAEGAELEMLQALLAYADAADAYFNPDDEAGIGDLVYVNATDCTFDGKTAGMVNKGDTVYFESDMVVGEGKVVNFEITNLETNGVTTIDAATAAAGYVVSAPISVAAVEGAADEKPKQFTLVTSADEITTGEYVIILSGVGKALGYYSNKWVTTATPTVSGNIVTDTAGAVWTLTVDGTKVKMQDANGEYIKSAAGNNNGIQVGEYTWELVWNSDNTVSFKGTGSDTTILAGNKGSSYQFRAYKTSTVSGTPASYPSTFLIYKLS